VQTALRRVPAPEGPALARDVAGDHKRPIA